jgi:V/A-type H+-transporting ATPase subunit I
MMMVNIIGENEEIDRICKTVISLGCLHPVSAMEEMNTADFTMRISEENKEAIMGVSYMKPFVSERSFSTVKEKMDKIVLMCCGTKEFGSISDDELILDYDELNSRIDEVLKEFEPVVDEFNQKKEKDGKYRADLGNFELLNELDIPAERLFGMKNFTFRLLRVTTENAVKLNHNRENIPAILISVKKSSEEEILIALVPVIFKAETDRIFKALNCEEITLDKGYSGTPEEVVKFIRKELEVLDSSTDLLKKSMEGLSGKYIKEIGVLVRSADLERKCGMLKNEIASWSEYFYLYGWVPEREINILEEKMKTFGEKAILIVIGADEVNIKTVPPTKLRNNKIFRPFETMVGLYGIPSYDEVDPTPFLGLSYMLLFGAMFGDVGQGAVLFIAGLYLKYSRKTAAAGDILCRLGLASALFGFAYGSVFGFETLVKPLFVRPMDNIMEVLGYAVVFGLLLMVSCFVLSMVNSIRRRDIGSGIFGKDGAAGLVLYFAVIGYIVSLYLNLHIMPGYMWGILIGVPSAMILLKEPVTNLIKGKRPLFSGKKQDYFIEGGFGIAEIILSMFTNTLSFIRIGAFALNHVGLFLAFSLLASMMNSGAGSFLVYLLGNIVIIALEGLIVFIQGLRLEYYELFSRYYEGAGIPFKPVRNDDKG